MRRFWQFLGMLYIYVREVCRWVHMRGIASRSVHGKSATATQCLIVTGDPEYVIGSRGDQALILSAVQQTRARCPDAIFSILVARGAPIAKIREFGLEPVEGWDLDVFWGWIRHHLTDYDHVFFLGADVADGTYGWGQALKFQILYDLFARAGVAVTFQAFSVSPHPSPWMKPTFALLRKGLPLPVRDPVSYRRLCRFTRHRPIPLVADAAFCLEPRVTPRLQPELAWCQKLHERGERILVVNLHSMFNGVLASGGVWERAVADVLLRLMAAHPELNLLLLPHDDRPGVSDNAVLRRLLRMISDRVADRVRLTENLNADEIKALVAHCDAVMSGRMHLSIAALGRSVPVFALVYQGKFEGLWEHFGLGSETLCNPARFVEEPDVLLRDMKAFLNSLTTLRACIRDALPKVLALSQSQFEGIEE